MPLESFIPTQRRNTDIDSLLVELKQRDYNISPNILKNFAGVIAALGYATGTTYMIFRHHEISEAAIASTTFAISTVPAIIHLEHREKVRAVDMGLDFH
mgnify:CR=1 FL=1